MDATFAKYAPSALTRTGTYPPDLDLLTAERGESTAEDAGMTSGPIIELASAYFYPDEPPSEISLHQCNLYPGHSSGFFALYGYQAKRDGMVAARQQGYRHSLNFLPIAIQVQLDLKQCPNLMKIEDLPCHDFVSFARMSRGLKDVAHAVLADLAGFGVLPKNTFTPDAICHLINHPQWAHMKLVAFLASPLGEQYRLMVAALSYRHWGSIVEATCPTHPKLKISLQTPEGVL